MTSTSHEPPLQTRPLLRQRLLARRAQFAGSAGVADASAALAHHLAPVLAALEPELLGVYWAHRGEFNALTALDADPALEKVPIALPFAQRTPVRMHYRRWDRTPPAGVDECGIPAPGGAAVVPDVVLVPCVGYTATGLRLGYGGGYFDRWLAEHPDVTAVGVAWSVGEVDAAAFAAEPHDRPMTLIVTERGVV